MTEYENLYTADSGPKEGTEGEFAHQPRDFKALITFEVKGSTGGWEFVDEEETGDLVSADTSSPQALWKQILRDADSAIYAGIEDYVIECFLRGEESCILQSFDLAFED